MSRDSRRLGRLPAYAVAELAEAKRRLVAQGIEVIDLGAGDADVPPPEVAVRALAEAAADPAMSRYAFQVGLPAFREAAAGYMRRRFGVTLDPTAEILPLLGSKEGLAHLPAAVVNPGEVCVLPDPGYPAYVGGAVLADAEIARYPLTAAGGFLVELDQLPAERLDRVRLVYVNYPNNPTAAVAPREYLERLVQLCRDRGIVIAYDNPYCEITFDGYRAPSILEIPGARDVAVEFHSLSKSFCMTGWRLAWAAGNAELVAALTRVKTYVDTGAFLAIQYAGAHVLERAAELVEPIRRRFAERRDAAVAALRDTGLDFAAPLATMYLWIPVPEGVSARSVAEDVLEREGVMVLPGPAFGPGGEGYVRLALTVDSGRLAEAARRIGNTLRRLAAAGARS